MQRRIEDLEVKLAFVEKHLAELDAIVRQSLDAMDDLQRQLKQVRAEIDVASESGDLAAERPPHHLGPVEG